MKRSSVFTKILGAAALNCMCPQLGILGQDDVN